jgi:hypothetical protein
MPAYLRAYHDGMDAGHGVVWGGGGGGGAQSGELIRVAPTPLQSPTTPDVPAVAGLEVTRACSVKATVDPRHTSIASPRQLLCCCKATQALLAANDHSLVLGDLSLHLRYNVAVQGKRYICEMAVFAVQSASARLRRPFWQPKMTPLSSGIWACTCGTVGQYRTCSTRHHDAVQCQDLHTVCSSSGSQK